MRKIKKIILAAVLCLSVMVPSTMQAYNFEGRENEFLEFCSQSLTNQDDADLCIAFKDYMYQKVNDIKDNMANMTSEIEKLKVDIENSGQQLKEYEKQLEEMNAQIEALEASIASLEAEIILQEEKIVEKEEDIALRDAQIKERMVDMQSFASINAYIDVIMGASDLVDLIRRVSVLQDITKYEQDQIEALNEAIKQLEFDKAELERMKQEAIDNKALVETQKANIESLKAAVEAVIAEYNMIKNQLEASIRESEIMGAEIQKNIPKINTTIIGNYVQSGDFWVPTNGWRSAGTWAYDTGGIHLGYDFAAPVGTPIIAPANSIVLYANNPAPTYGGYLGNWIGWPAGGGNTVSLAAQVNGTTYMFSFFHMAQENFVAKGRETFNQGEVIGYVGHSGNSTGAHLHFEVINMGNMSLSEVINRFNVNADFSGGTGWSSTATACSSTGWATPCRERPEDILGI